MRHFVCELTNDRLVRLQGELSAALLGPIWQATRQSLVGRCANQLLFELMRVLTVACQAPIVVFNDADLDSAVNGAAFACFVASGQTCVSGTRLIVQDGIYQTFMARFLEKVESIRARMGDRETNRPSTALLPHIISLSLKPQIHNGHCYLNAPARENRGDDVEE